MKRRAKPLRICVLCELFAENATVCDRCLKAMNRELCGASPQYAVGISDWDLVSLVRVVGARYEGGIRRVAQRYHA